VVSFFYKNDDWEKLFGRTLFHICEEIRTKYNPAFRSLISYFIRRTIDAYSKPFTRYRNQNPFDWQINNAFLLGLNWEHAADAQEIRDKNTGIKALESAVKSEIVLTQGELEAERLRLEKIIILENNAIENYKVIPQYKDLQDKVNTLTTDMHQYSDKLFMLQRKLSRYEYSITSKTGHTAK
jgi:uncharacterized protein YydD (DUF2326 family)